MTFCPETFALENESNRAMLRNIGATIFGLIVGMIFNYAFIILNSQVCFPLPEGVTMEDQEGMKEYVASLPAQGFFLVLVAHVGQAGVGGWIAGKFAASRPALLVWIIGILTLIGAVYNLLTLGGPAWMWIDVPLILAASWFVGNAATKCHADKMAAGAE